MKAETIIKKFDTIRRRVIIFGLVIFLATVSIILSGHIRDYILERNDIGTKIYLVISEITKIIFALFKIFIIINFTMTTF